MDIRGCERRLSIVVVVGAAFKFSVTDKNEDIVNTHAFMTIQLTRSKPTCRSYNVYNLFRMLQPGSSST